MNQPATQAAAGGPSSPDGTLNIATIARPSSTPPVIMRRR